MFMHILLYIIHYLMVIHLTFLLRQIVLATEFSIAWYKMVNANLSCVYFGIFHFSPVKP